MGEWTFLRIAFTFSVVSIQTKTWVSVEDCCTCCIKAKVLHSASLTVVKKSNNNQIITRWVYSWAVNRVEIEIDNRSNEQSVKCSLCSKLSFCMKTGHISLFCENRQTGLTLSTGKWLTMYQVRRKTRPCYYWQSHPPNRNHLILCHVSTSHINRQKHTITHVFTLVT